MPDCEEAVYSNDYYDFIVEKQDLEDLVGKGYCIQELDANYGAVYYRMAESGGESGLNDISYHVIPKCFGLLEMEQERKIQPNPAAPEVVQTYNAALDGSGILKVRDQPNLALTGRGVLLGFVDTDFDYTNPLFCNIDGTTRIERIWNQADRSGMPPQGFLYGTEYTREQINEELHANHDAATAKIPYANGHGTFLAAVAAGSVDMQTRFSGAAPECDIAFVQLKPAKQYLKDFYFIPDETPVFQENDIMAAVRYLNLLAVGLRRPLSLCIALGTNMGNRGGQNPISHTLMEVSLRRQRCVAIAAGNEADKRHHFLGEIREPNGQERVEISVSEGVTGFIAEMWAMAPELYEITIHSPTGERFHALPSVLGTHLEHRFLFEGTVVAVDYLLTGAQGSNELIYIRFTKPISGIWALTVTVRNFMDGNYHVWLPMSKMTSGEVIFLRSNPDTTLTVPSDTELPITVAGYNSKDGSIYFESGRGYTAAKKIKPDITAPAVDIYGPVGGGKYEARSGTSIAAAITAGAGALMLEWTGVRRNNLSARTVDIKNYFIRGAARDEAREYPSEEWGWGKLNLYSSFEQFRNV